ncbi:MAG: prolipoprotein diacylglyceryl transferase [Buchnera aphidicola (Periphyllus aceris)]|nr:prolipoprotein diacylglyceryl transferase [Buchnera aphidicola (Periphyllus aceris)]
MYILFPKINPNYFSFGIFSFKWYGLMYLICFIYSIWYGKKYLKKNNKLFKKKYVNQIIYYCFIGLFFGGRIGYVLLYKFFYFLQHKFYLFQIWNGGMSFHGGLIGVIIACFIFSIKKKIKFFKITDFIAILSPFSLGIGRLGNFVNDELWGRIAINTPGAFLFPNSLKCDLNESKKNPILQKIIEKYGVLPRYPSQLFEFFLEGVILFIIINYCSKKITKKGIISSIFLIFYGIFRIFLENFREPDMEIGFFYKKYTLGQILSIPMIIVGIFLLIFLNIKNKKNF